MGFAESDNKARRWRLTLFGGFRAVADDGTVVERFRTQKSLLLLVRLALPAPSQVSREQIAEWLWPDRPPTDQRTRLRYEVNVLRSTLGATAVRSIGNDFIALGDGVTSDVQEFRGAVAEARNEEAITLYNGDLLTGIYDDWILEQRSLLRDAAQDSFLQAIAAAQQEGRESDARQLRRTLIARLPGIEERAIPEPPSSMPLPALPPLFSPPDERASGAPEAREIRLTLAPSSRHEWRSIAYGYLPIATFAIIYVLACAAIPAILPQWNFSRDYSVDAPLFHDWSIGVLHRNTQEFDLADHIGDQHDEKLLTRYRNFEKGGFAKNVSSASLFDFTAKWQPGQVSMHPNEGKHPATAIRWNCPIAGDYAVHARFWGTSCEPNYGTTVDVYAERGSVLLWHAPVRGSAVCVSRDNSHPVASYDTTLSLSRNESLTWFMDDAGKFVCDQTGLDLTLRPLWSERLLQIAPLVSLFPALLAGGIVYRISRQRPPVNR